MIVLRHQRSIKPASSGFSFARDWCKGSGVPGDPLSGGHQVPAEWANTAWKDWRVSTLARVYVGKRPRCRYCDQTRRDYRKNLNRNKAKAQNTIGAHARRYGLRWECSTAEARRRLDQYGWTVAAIAEMFDAAKAAGLCSECDWQYDHGEHEMTLDVNDPTSLPLLASNVSVICRTCNTAKQGLSLVEWRERQAYIRAILHPSMPRQLELGEDK